MATMSFTLLPLVNASLTSSPIIVSWGNWWVREETIHLWTALSASVWRSFLFSCKIFHSLDRRNERNQHLNSSLTWEYLIYWHYLVAGLSVLFLELISWFCVIDIFHNLYCTATTWNYCTSKEALCILRLCDRIHWLPEIPIYWAQKEIAIEILTAYWTHTWNKDNKNIKIEYEARLKLSLALVKVCNKKLFLNEILTPPSL